MTEVAYHYRFLSTAPLPLWLGLVLLCASVAAALWLLHREQTGRRGKALSRWLYATRAAVVTCLALLVIQPVLFIRRDETRPALLILAADRSRSMLRSDPYDAGALLNLVATIGGSDLRGREELPDRARKQMLGWQREIARWQIQIAQSHDDLIQGVPPRSTFEPLVRETLAQLRAGIPKIRSACDDLAQLQRRWGARAEVTSTNAAKGPDPQWFLAPNQFLDRMTKLEENLRSVSSSTLSEDKSLSLLRAGEDALAGLKAAADALSALQSYCDAQFEKTLSQTQRTELQKLNEASRFSLAARTMAAITNQVDLARRHTIQILGASPLDGTNAADHTDLFEAVKQAVASAGQRTLAGIVLVSDGQQNLPERPEVMRELVERGVPFIAAGVGLRETLPDVAIANYQLPTTLLAGSRATVRADLKTAVPKDTEIVLTLALNGAALAEKRWKADGTEARISLEFAVPPAVNGPLVLAAKTPQPDGAPNNDQVEIGVTVLPEQARILVLAPSARWDIVYLLRALARTPWRVDTLFWGRDQGEDEGKSDKAEITKRLSQLKNYRLVVLDGRPFDGFTEEDVSRLKDYVTKDGGSLLVIASATGPWYGEKLASFMGIASPQAPSDNSARLEPTADAAHYPIVSLAADVAESVALWKRLAAPQQVRPVPTQNVPLMMSQQQTCLSLGFYGRGKVYALGCSDLFRLREWDGAPAMDRFLANLVDDALRPVFSNPAARLAIYPAMPLSGSTAHVLVEAGASTAAPTAESLKFTRANSASLYDATLRISKAGPITLDVSGQDKLLVQALASVSLEDVNFGLDSARLKQLADLSGGSYVSLSELARELGALPARKDVTTTMRIIRLWNLWFLLPLLVALMTVDWVLRRKQGLVL